MNVNYKCVSALFFSMCFFFFILVSLSTSFSLLVSCYHTYAIFNQAHTYIYIFLFCPSNAHTDISAFNRLAQRVHSTTHSPSLQINILISWIDNSLYNMLYALCIYTFSKRIGFCYVCVCVYVIYWHKKGVAYYSHSHSV